MSKYKISNVTVETSKNTGKNYRRFDAVDETGAEFTGVAAFDSFSQYGNLLNDSTVEGTLETKEYKGRPSYTLKDAYKGNGGGNKAGFSQEMFNKKNENIKDAQENKNHAIMVSSTFSSATAITVALIEKGEVLPADWEVSWTKTRHKLVKLWNDLEQAKQPSGADYPKSLEEEIPF